ncbi:MAG: type I-E CRISPR-associated protein Cas5/CasD [Candidatus Cloacimonetes bacterium]|jgi:CRISPR system Cascade subunit CasD|nr:type I-E CRISPR-associated protein Cas5/CasD [Candidatus Cloacimonadota bacterium]MCK9335212.1 type I-E CRISPR-associated protein Cas5/CasD [Candidatus Cloacimonadota bacterium]
MESNTLFLRLEGHLQAWGSHESKLAIRRTQGFPSKSAIAGILCAALGIPRENCSQKWLPTIAMMKMGVRIDRPGIRWWDYHTVGAGQNMPIADYPAEKLENISKPLTENEANMVRKVKPVTMLTRREYLSDASFLVALQGPAEIIKDLQQAIESPKWQLFLGRKNCPPSRPIAEHGTGYFESTVQALASLPIAKGQSYDDDDIVLWLDWEPNDHDEDIPDSVEQFYDVPVSFSPHVYKPRYVYPISIPATSFMEDTTPYPQRKWRPERPRANYQNSEYKQKRAQRLIFDHGLCVFCKSPATTVQHISYAHAGGDESLDELRSMCRLCHDAATMLEYGAKMGMYRIDPCDPGWREALLAKRRKIVQFRSREKRAEIMQRKAREE